jgi:hypothetical protein
MQMKPIEPFKLDYMREFNKKKPDTTWHAYENINPESKAFGIITYIAVGRGCFHQEAPKPTKEYSYLGTVNPYGEDGII